MPSTNWRRVFSLLATGPSVSGLLKLNRSSTVACWDSSIDASGNLLDTSGNARNLAPTNSPTRAVSTLQGQDGNRWLGRTFNGTTQCYSKAHDASMNVFDTDHTLTMVLASTATGGYQISHGEANVSGMYISSTGANVYRAVYSKSGSNATVSTPTLTFDSKYHILQLVRRSGIATFYLDGVAGASSDVSTFGIDASEIFYLSCYRGPAAYNPGSILYTRLDNAALTDAQLEYDRSVLTGLGLGTTWGASLDFARAGTAYQTFSDGTMALRPAGMPRVGDGVLIEGAGTNMLAYTNDFSTGWTKGRSSIAATSVVLPNGTTGTTNTLHENATAGNTHYVSRAAGAVTTGSSYGLHVKMKYNAAAATPREWIRLQIDDSLTNQRAYFNVRYGYVGTTALLLGGGTQVKPLGNGWFEFWIWMVAGATGTANISIDLAEADNDVTFDGLDQDTVFIFGPQFEAGSFPTSYTPNATTSTANGRPADDLSLPTYRLRNTLKDIVSTTPTMWLDFDVDPSGATITDKSGAYTLTKAGQPKRYTSPVYGDYHLFDGAADYYSTDNAGMGPAGDFSFSVAFTPSTVSGEHTILARWNAAGDVRSYRLYQDGTSVVFSRSTDGLVGTVLSATKTSALVAGKPCLVTATYSTTGGLNVYVDALTVASQAATGAIYVAGVSNFFIGIHAAGSTYISGKLHNLYYYNGTVLSAANHAALYAAWKQAGVLPTSVGSADHYKKIRIVGEYRGRAASQSGVIIDIGGAIGASDADTNRIKVAMATTTLRCGVYGNGESTERFSTYTVAHDRWNSFDLVLNLADLTASTLTVNGLAGTLDVTTMTGAKTLNLLDTWITVGNDYAKANPANADIRGVVGYIASD